MTSAHHDDMIPDDAAVYVISVAANLAGLHPQTLRQYDRMGLVQPSRAGGKYRLYSMRDVRKTYTKTYDSLPQGASEGSSFSGNASKVRFTNCPTQSVWFSDFLLGAEDRMGYDTKKQKYL